MCMQNRFESLPSGSPNLNVHRRLMNRNMLVIGLCNTKTGFMGDHGDWCTCKAGIRVRRSNIFKAQSGGPNSTAAVHGSN